MQEKISSIFKNVKEWLAKFPKKSIITFSSIAAFVLVGALIFTIILNQTNYEILFTGLTQEETTEVMAKLQEMNVPQKLEGNGTILVPDKNVLQTKALLVSQGYPSSGFTYDIFNGKVNLMSTDFDKATYLLQDLQNRISATIRIFEGVVDCTVNIALGDDKKYVLEKDKVNTTAAVVVVMEPGKSLSTSQVEGIRRLVSKSIPGIVIDDIVITDGEGNELNEANKSLQVSATDLKRKLEQEYENSITNKLVKLIEPVFGTGKFSVAVNTVYDIDKKLKEILNYIPSQDNKGVINSEKTTQEKVDNKETQGDTPGTDTNAEEEVPTYPGVSVDGNEIYFKDEKSYEYLVSQVKEQIESDSGTLTDASVAVTIDGQALDQDQSNSLKRLIANAAGINVNDINNKIEILYLPYYNTQKEVDNNNVINPQIIYIGIGSAAVFILLLTIILILLLKKKKSKKMKELAIEQQTQVGEEFGVSQMQQLEDFKISEIIDTREKELQKEISSFTESNPEIAAQLLKNWLRGGEVSSE